MSQSRREFFKAVGTTTIGAAISPNLFSNPTGSKASQLQVCVFTKCLQFLDYERLGETLAFAGFDGADLPVRPDGLIHPNNIEVELPKVVKVLKKSGIGVPMMVTAITMAEDPSTERILGTASEVGIKFYRTGYLNYDQAKSIQENLDNHKRSFEKLEKINRKYGIHGAYQNHSGTRVGGPVWDLFWIVKDFNPDYIGIQYDICHAVCEGGVSWPLGMRLLAPWIKMTDIKDFLWEKVDNNWKATYVPLGKGMVNFNQYLREYMRFQLTGPVSIHFEYDLGGAQLGKSNPTMSLTNISAFLKTDYTWFRNKLKEFGID
jgi:L-ribulose-5-phosphate 3-epimerase